MFNRKETLFIGCCQVKPEHGKYLARAEVTTALSLLNCNSPGYADIVWKVLEKHALDIDTDAGGLQVLSVHVWLCACSI